jgi:polycystin 2
LDGLYWETWYNDRNITGDEKGYIFYENKLLGLPRLRQLKVKNDSCTIHDDFKDQIKTCYDSYAEAIEETGPLRLDSNGSA